MQRASVRVFAAMAAHAVIGELLGSDRRRMTVVAVDLGVRAHQCKLGFRGMIISHRPPPVVVMAIGALGAETGGVSIVRPVAAIAVLRDLILVISASVAGEAGNLGVRAQERIARLFEMVELRSPPLLRDMALCALFAARPAVIIVGLVTTDARPRRRLVAAADVTGIARRRHVRPRQFEVRLVVIEPSAGPTQGAVALAARLFELPAVRIGALVAAGAVRRSLAPRIACFVATIAGQRGVRPLEREVGQMMIETRGTQLYDIGCAALVFRVASTAFTDAGVGHAPVMAVMLPQIACDFLVAVLTQRGLGPDIGAVVAICAIFFLLFMGARHFARHQQCFHRTRQGARDRNQRDCHDPHCSTRIATSMCPHDLNQ